MLGGRARALGTVSMLIRAAAVETPIVVPTAALIGGCGCTARQAESTGGGERAGRGGVVGSAPLAIGNGEGAWP